MAAVLAVFGGGSFLVNNLTGPACGAELIDSPTAPLQSATLMQQRPNSDRDRVVGAVAAMGPPFGPVVAGRDYYYDQFLRLYAVPDGVLALTRNNADLTYLADSDLAPRWALRPTAKRTAWDTSPDRFVLLNLEESKRITIADFDLRDGAARWCVEVGLRHRDGDPVATTFLPDGDLLAALPSGPDIAMLRLGAADGEQQWSRKISTADRADYLGLLTDELVLVGGTEEARLGDPAPAGAAAPAVSAVSVADGSVRWTWDDGPGARLHVVGVVDGSALVLSRTTAGTDLVALSAEGSELRRTALAPGAREATLRGQVVVVRGKAGLRGYDVATGNPLWQRAIPTDRPYVPLGFPLSQMPSVDADHLLLPTVSSLELLDLTDGTSESFAMPTDGLSSAYFPYQLLVTARHLGVVTNTGTVLATRE